MNSNRQAALITGSSRGIGFSVADAFARAGIAVVINSPVDDEELQTAKASLLERGVTVEAIAADVSDLTQHEALLEQAEAAVGPLSTLVNNAGVSVVSRGDVLDVTEESYDRCQAVNAKAQFFLAQRWAKRLLSRDRNDGRFYALINVSSSNAVAAAEQRAEYCVSKAASAMTSKVFAVRLGREGIAVYDIQPGVIDTPMTASVMDAYRDRISNEGLTLLPRVGNADEVATCITTLATGRMPYTTGQTITVDGGLILPRF